MKIVSERPQATRRRPVIVARSGGRSGPAGGAYELVRQDRRDLDRRHVRRRCFRRAGLRRRRACRGRWTAQINAATEKFNAYVDFLNRTLRASESIDRYKSWVNWTTGPTGRERIIYGLYDVYDTSGEAAKATAATKAEPLMPELDAAMRDYVAANAALAPILTKANGYYERADYKVDKMAKARRCTQDRRRRRPFLAARAKVDALIRDAKAKVDLERLAAIDKEEGRSARGTSPT